MERLVAFILIICILTGCSETVAPAAPTQSPSTVVVPTQTGLPASTVTPAPRAITLIPVQTPTSQVVSTATAVTQVVTTTPVSRPNTLGVTTDIRSAKEDFALGEEVYVVFYVTNYTDKPVTFTIEVFFNGIPRVTLLSVVKPITADQQSPNWMFAPSFAEFIVAPGDIVVEGRFTSEGETTIALEPPVVSKTIHIH